jgi:hypothetical protein
VSIASRAAKTIAILSASRRRATNASTRADARSSHWASSTRQSSGLRYEVEDSEPDQERVRRRSGTEPEGYLERDPLRLGQALHEVQARRAQLLDSRERELHLPFDPHRTDDREVRSRLGRIVQQRRLADARLPVDGKHAAVALARCLEHAGEYVALALPAEKLQRGFPSNHLRSMPLG